jgi:flagellar protein FliS
MNQDVQQTYLEAEISTATPQKLRLMLIEGALRFAKQTAACWEKNQSEAGWETLVRCRDVVSELIGGVKTDDSELARQVLAIYLYLHRTLTTAQADRNLTLMADVIRVLEEERQTWEAVCQAMPEAPEPPEAMFTESSFQTGNETGSSLHELSPGYGAGFEYAADAAALGGFSLEA